MNGPMTTLYEPESKMDRPFTFDYSFWSHDGFVVDADGVSRKDGDQSNYADQDFVYETLGK